MKRPYLGLTAIVLGILSCSRPASGGGQVPRRPASYHANWSQAPDGAAPIDFVDIQQSQGTYPFLYDGQWRIVHREGECRLSVDTAQSDPPEPLTFRRYDADAFGPHGELPEHFRVTAEARSLGGSARFNGYGELAMEVCYLSPISYVEVLQTDQSLCLWQADHAPPMQGAGWSLLARIPHPKAVGDWVHFGAEVDRRTHRITALLDGVPVASASSKLLSRPDAGLTLRATGNREEWRSVTIEELP